MYECDGQLSIFDWMPTLMQEPELGAYVEETGAIIPHIMRPSYIGHKVLYDCSTQSHRCYHVGILERYFWFESEGTWRSVVFYGKKQRALIDHNKYEHPELYECLPWDAYPKRMEAIGCE